MSGKRNASPGQDGHSSPKRLRSGSSHGSSFLDEERNIEGSQEGGGSSSRASADSRDRSMPSKTDARVVLDKTFELILDTFADSDDVLKSLTTIFVVYAHENERLAPEKKADAESARKIIKWLRSLRSRVKSDRSPLVRDSGDGRDTDTSGVHNILSNQLCLLPNIGNFRKGDDVRPVDKVILCRSEVLQVYLEDAKMKDYLQKIKEFYDFKKRLRTGTKEERSEFREGLEQILMEYRQSASVATAPTDTTLSASSDPDTGFHHVVTEMAFLKLREQENPECKTIVPVILNGKSESNELRVWLAPSDKLKLHKSQPLHRVFFRLLKRIFVELSDTIMAFETCYTNCVEIFSDDQAEFGHLTDQGFFNKVESEINKALKEVNRDLLANIRMLSYKKDMLQIEATVDQNAIRDAKVALKDYYSTPGRLSIERISGEQLPMEQCYINLAIVEKPEDREKKQSKSPSSLFARLKVDEVRSDIHVALPELFDPRKSPSGTNITPRRILIRGDAGVGKTTLCKKIVYDYIHNNRWQDLFDYLLWIPLRQLKGKSKPTYNLEKLIHHVYFPTRIDWNILATALSKPIENPITGIGSSRTLFLLDGLDEVSDEVNSTDGISTFLQYLLRKPNVIITSRPQRLNRNYLGTLDLELETIGFSQAQVKAYISNRDIIKDPEKAVEIQSFLKANPLMQGLVRIPIQLDAVCYCWDLADFSHDSPKTMTNIYTLIVQKLWRKDISFLKKMIKGGQSQQNDFDQWDQFEFDSIIKDEINFLNGFAFIGLNDNIIEFDSKDRTRIKNELYNQDVELPKPYIKTLNRLSFLRTSDKGSRLPDAEQSYHFLHLTFQEYFAAKYFVSRWTAGRESKLNPGRASSISPREFLQKEKYNPRYIIFWRFVAGLMQTSGNEELVEFFRRLDDEPGDLLGLTHQRLIMNCLCEISLSNPQTIDFEPIRDSLENKLFHWVLFELKADKDRTMIRQSEFPERLLKNLLEEDNAETRIRALVAIKERPSVTSDILDTAVSWFNTSRSARLRIESIRTLISNIESSSKERLESIILSFKDKNYEVRRAVANALGRQASLRQEILTSLTGFLKDEDSRVRRAAADALGRQASLPQEILTSLTDALKDEDSGVRYTAAKALGGQASLPQEILTSLTGFLKDEDSHVRYTVAEALGRQASLPQEILTSLTDALKDEDSGVGYTAADALSRQASLPQEILTSLTGFLKDEDSGVRLAATVALSHQATLPQEILTSLTGSLKDEDSDVRYIAADILGNQTIISNGIIDNLLLTLVAVSEERSFERPRLTNVIFKHDYFYSIFPGLEPSQLKAVYKGCLAESFRQESSWYLQDGHLFINVAEGLRKVRFENDQQRQRFGNAIHEARLELGYPTALPLKI
ncbi:hypothetical protein BP5796_02295 [Coleophoma crateriformis]|uniref:NACHT domain-containing protein n=1 Tax=Coleophoma crateriformis TaxID=565419 RepID=A0A3D8SXZ7_9HELO|nr:hypothetical protein BP5796_02295 [Coleophoma crateriformis]